MPGWTSSPPWTYALILTGSCVIMAYAANLGRFGVVTAIAMHAAFNTVSSYLNGLFTCTQPRVSVPFELVMALSGLATGFGLLVATRGRLAYHPDEDLNDEADPLEPWSRLCGSSSEWPNPSIQPTREPPAKSSGGRLMPDRLGGSGSDYVRFDSYRAGHSEMVRPACS